MWLLGCGSWPARTQLESFGSERFYKVQAWVRDWSSLACLEGGMDEMMCRADEVRMWARSALGEAASMVGGAAALAAADAAGAAQPPQFHPPRLDRPPLVLPSLALLHAEQQVMHARMVDAGRAEPG